MNKTKKTIIMIVLVLVLVIVNLTVYTKKFLQPKIETKVNKETTTAKEETQNEEPASVPQTDDEIIKMLAGLKERDRIEYYCGQYFKHIERHEYEAAYNLLYTEFKKNYFPTIEEYEEYIEKTYPETWALDYDDITRQGNIYVLRLKILDVLGSRENEKIQRVVVKENYYNDFVISFQVI